MSELNYGRRSVIETLRADRRRLYRLWIQGLETDKLKGNVALIHELATARQIPIRFVQGGLFEKLTRDGINAQGVALEVGDYPYVDVIDCLEFAKRQNEPPLILVSDHLQDPQNLGSLIRTAEVLGVHGLIIPQRRAARITPAVSNASAGAVEHMRVAQVTNLNRTIDDLKREQIWITGLDNQENTPVLKRERLEGPLAIVVGSEGKGISRLTREKCDFLVRLSMRGQVESLNAAVAGSIVLYLASETRAGASG